MDVDKFLCENVILLFFSNSSKLIHVTLYTKMYRKIKNQNIASLSENSSVERGGRLKTADEKDRNFIT